MGIGTDSPDAFTKLTVAGAMTLTGQNTGHGASRIKIGQDTTAISQIRFYGADASTAGILQFIGSSSDGTVGDERMRIDSSGQVGIGITNPSDYFANFNDLVVGSTSADSGITIVSSTSDDGTLAFADGTSGTSEYSGYIQYSHGTDNLSVGTAGAERMRIDSSGNVSIKASGADQARTLSLQGTNGASETYQFNLIADGENAVAKFMVGVGGGAATERMRILSGGGITFNGDTTSANALDDYEEGTWSPIYTSSTGSFTTNLATAFSPSAIKLN